MRTMKTLIVALLFAALPATASDGFFRPLVRHQEDPPREQNIGPKDTTFDCSMTIQYNAGRPTWSDITFPSMSCLNTAQTALGAAALSAKVFVPGEPAIPPTWDCTASVAWNMATPDAPQASFAGTCPSGTGAVALNYAARIVNCQLHARTVLCPTP